MKFRGFLLSLFLIGFTPVFSQYLSNPSFEGTILMIGPPPGWEICIVGSTPNVQPGKYNVYLPPSDGYTYIGLLTRDNGTWEDMHSELTTPLSKDSCYTFSIDLAYQQYLSFTAVDPVLINVYGSNINCQKDNLLWSSPPISNDDWETFQFTIHNPEYDITDLNIEAYFIGIFPYEGYVLLDNIKIERYPEFELGNDTTLTFCENDSLILDPGPGFVNFLWQDGSTDPVFIVDSTGLYWVQAFNEEGCSWTDSIFVTAEEYLPMVSEMMDSTLVCKGMEVPITVTVSNGAGPYSYQWLNLPYTSESIIITAESTKFYYVFITDKCGNTLKDSVKIVVDNPDIDLGNDTLICSDGSFSLHAGPGYSQYLWTGGSTDSVLAVTEPGIYWVEVTSNFGCIARDTIVVNLFPPISLDLGEDTTACIGDSVTFYAGNDFVDYLWQDNSTNSALTAYNSGIYWVTVTDNNGCHATDSVSASFLSMPEIDLGSDTSICSGEQMILDAGSGFQSYQWNNNSTQQLLAVTEGGLYWVTVDNGCGEDTDSIYIELYPKPEPELGPDTIICFGETITFDFGSQYVSYLWQDNSTLPFYSVSSGGIYAVTVENNYGCFGDDEVFVSVSDSQVDLGVDQQVCEGDTIVLDAGDGFVSYLWQDNSNEQSLLVSLPGQYSVTAVDEHDCETSDDVAVSFYPHPHADLGPDLTICEGESTLLQAPEGEFNYYWNGVEGGSSLEVTSPGNYSLAMVNPCDSAYDVMEVKVDPKPYVFLGEDNILFPGMTIQLDAGEGFEEYSWQDGSGDQFFVVTENNLDPSNPYYYVEVTKGACKNADTIRIELYQIWVPQLITPNEDGKNDMFQADPQHWTGINSHNMMVFNRWGEKIWESSDFESGWDGKQNGKPVSDGTYFWILDVFVGPDNLKHTLKGSLTVLDSNY